MIRLQGKALRQPTVKLVDVYHLARFVDKARLDFAGKPGCMFEAIALDE